MDLDYRLGHLGFTFVANWYKFKNYMNGMQLVMLTEPRFSYDHYVLYSSSGHQIFSRTVPRC